MKTNNHGFTLLELMLVIVILGVLVAMGTGTYLSSVKKGRDSQRKNDLHSITVALETYFTDKGQYPGNDGSFQIVGCGAVDDPIACAWGSMFSDGNGTVYMPKIPIDPVMETSYHYEVGLGNRSYQLYARLENTKDTSVQNDSGQAIIYTGVTCGSKTCNYGVASSNTTPQAGRTVDVDPSP